jgi:hypothetical protein
MAAVTIARRFGDRDLEFSAQALLGHAYVASGRVEEGMSLIDEAMAAIPAGEVARIDSIGEIYCRLLGACELATDVRRAEQWIATAQRFVQWGDFVPLPVGSTTAGSSSNRQTYYSYTYAVRTPR